MRKMERISRKLEFTSDISLFGVSLIWGSTFIIVKQAIEHVPTFSFLSMRFLIAVVLLSSICIKRFSKINRRLITDGFFLGFVLFLAFAFQTLGLKTTSASVTGFITGLFVVIVPILSAVLLKKKPHFYSMAGVLISFVGLAMITLDDKITLSKGEMIVLVNAVFCSLHIVLTDYYSRRNDIYLLTVMQFVVILTCSLIVSFIFEPYVIPEQWNSQLLAALGLTGVFATVVAFLISTGMQKFTTPTKAAIIYCMEPVSSAIFSYFIGGEVLSFKQYLGAFLVVCAMLIAEVGAYIRMKSNASLAI